MHPADARELLDALAEETDRLRDPAGLQFAGGTSGATAAARDALAAQLANVPETRAVLTAALPGPGTAAVVDGYEAAVADALDRVRRGAAPEQDAPPATPPAVAPTAHRDGTARPAGTARPDGRAHREHARPTRPGVVLAVVVALAVLVVLVVLALAG